MEMSEPTPQTGPPDMEKMMALAARYDNEILGPLPEYQRTSTEAHIERSQCEGPGHCSPGPFCMLSTSDKNSFHALG
jgi:hypothetical protein